MTDARSSTRVGEPPPPDDQAAGSFGTNAWLVEDMYDRFLVDPSSVGESWREFFAGYRPGPLPSPRSSVAERPRTQRNGQVPAPPSPNLSPVALVPTSPPTAPSAGNAPVRQSSPEPVVAADSSAVGADEDHPDTPVALRGAASRLAANMQAS